jgi:formylmethanofuran dehydrogenase subunit E
MLTKIELNRMEYRKIAANGIEPDGLARIAELLEGAGIPAEIMELVEPVWATKRGTYPKRLAKTLRAHGHTATPALMGAIGQIAADNSSRTDEYYFRIDREFTCEESGFQYDMGEHGDDNSCYHPGGQYAHAPYDIEAAGGMLLRTFEPASVATGYHDERSPDGQIRHYAGIARCFLVPTYVAGDGDYLDTLVMINGYCNPGYSHDLLHMARLVATVEGIAYRKVRVRDVWGNIFVNGDSGYLLGPWEAIHDVKSVDVYVTSSGRTPTRVVYNCASCGERYYDEEDLTVVGDDLICPECLRIDYIPCRRCGEWTLKWNAPEVSGEQWCRHCADEYSTVCAQCGERHPKTETYKVGREVWCEDCFNRYAVECSECGCYSAPGDIYETTGRSLCWDCAHNRCAQCGEEVSRPLKIDNRPYCRQCAPV